MIDAVSSRPIRRLRFLLIRPSRPANWPTKQRSGDVAEPFFSPAKGEAGVAVSQGELKELLPGALTRGNEIASRSDSTD